MTGPRGRMRQGARIWGRGGKVRERKGEGEQADGEKAKQGNAQDGLPPAQALVERREVGLISRGGSSHWPWRPSGAGGGPRSGG